MAKDKKAKGQGKQAKLAEKKLKQGQKADKKAKTKQAKLDGSDAEDVDLDQVLEDYKRQQEQFLKITETVVPDPPKPRSACTFLASPSNSNQLLLFGGEYFNGSLASFFNDLHIYHIDRDEWRTVTCPNAPLPRSGHAWCRGGNQAQYVFLFGGEFSSPKQGTFYHYNDFWRLEPATREWMRLESKGKTPPARSGHRMVYFKQYIVLFGGFQDTANSTKYLADLWLYDTANFVWYNPTLPTAGLRPDARSSFTFLPHERGACLFGGYSRVKASVAIKQKGNKNASGMGQKNVLKPMVHQDCFYLFITPAAYDAPPNTPPIVRWEKRKRPANIPEPSRAGATMAYHKGRGILFGGVHDVEASEEGIESEFFNGLFAWNIERNRFFPMALRKSRVAPKKAANAGAGGGGGGGARRARAQDREQELLQQLAALETAASQADASNAMEVDSASEQVENVEKEEEVKPMREMPISIELPHPRFNAQVAVQDDVLYIYGGTFEKGDREFTLNDLYAIDLGRMDGCKEIFNVQSDDWIASEDEDDSDEDEDEDDEMDEEDSEAENDDEDDEEMADTTKAKLFTPSKRNKQPSEADSLSTAASSSLASPTTTAPSSVAADIEQEAEEQPVDDGLPHPRPFESRREFFQRTSHEWQDLLMTSLRWKNIAPETLAIKEIKAKAFEMSEEKWWDCREEITALEDEQEAAGIGEVVSLADRGDVGGGGGGGAGGGGRRR